LCWQVLADEGMAKSIAFDEIDKAPEEKQRGITIATVSTLDLLFMSTTTNNKEKAVTKVYIEFQVLILQRRFQVKVGH
jgi:translation elongation factor EF-Tu-like GTPase